MFQTAEIMQSTDPDIFIQPDSSLQPLYDQHHSIARWVANTIVQETKLESRVSLLDLFIKIAHSSQEMGNFEALSALCSGLRWRSVDRLVGTWDELNEETARSWKEVGNFLLQPKQIWYRTALSKVQSGKVAFPAIVSCLDYANNEIALVGKQQTKEKLRRHQERWSFSEYIRQNQVIKQDLAELYNFLKNLNQVYKKEEDECFMLSKSIEGSNVLRASGF